jgi:hypothetical protein
MPKASPITRDHILDAMTYVGSDPAEWPSQSRPKLYLVIDPRNGAVLPPKLVLNAAAELASRHQRHPIYNGGQHTNRMLQALGFSIVEKLAVADSPAPAAVS